jgi:hypothetical protein
MEEKEITTDSVHAPKTAEPVAGRHVVNPIALQNCVVRFGELSSRPLDISSVRVLTECAEAWPVDVDQKITLVMQLDRIQFQAEAKLRAKGTGWMRFALEKLPPSARADLRAFLSPKKVGESIVEDWRTETVRHFHGLNESELWFDQTGRILFTYLDQNDPGYQFILRIVDPQPTITAGKIKREDYIDLGSVEAELPLAPLTDREILVRLAECRDIVTNFRPSGQLEYNLKQRLLRVISDHLYSTTHKVNMLPRPAPRPSASTTPLNN